MDPSSAVGQPEDSAASTEQLALSIPKPVFTMADAATIEFAPGLRRPPSLGTPPPPPRPGDPLYSDRLGSANAGSSGQAWRVLVPVVGVGLLVVSIGVGLAYLGGHIGTPVPAAAPQTLPEPTGTSAAAAATPAGTTAVSSATTATAATSAVSTPTAHPSTTRPVVDQSTQPPPPPPPPASLTGPGPVAFGSTFSVAANNFACAGGQLQATLGGHPIPAGTVDGAGNGSIVVSVGPDGQVGGPPNSFVLAKGTWTIIAAIPEQSGCTASAASVTIVVT
jgi:hypothetical protein